MNFNEEHIALFDHYLNGELTATEKSSFENRLSSDPDFAEAFADFQSFEKHLADAEITAFKDQLSEWDKSETETTPKKTRIIPLKFIAIAASIALASFLVFKSFFTTPSNEALVAEYFTPYDNVITIRGVKEDIDAGMVLYEAEDYEAAIQLFEQYDSNSTALFYMAESLLTLKAYNDAITTYEKVLKNPDIFKEVAEFHLGLAYLGADNTEAAVRSFEAIKEESDYYQEAQLLLETLK